MAPFNPGQQSSSQTWQRPGPRASIPQKDQGFTLQVHLHFCEADHILLLGKLGKEKKML